MREGNKVEVTSGGEGEFIGGCFEVGQFTGNCIGVKLRCLINFLIN